MRSATPPELSDQENPTLRERIAALAFRSRRRLATGVAVVIAIFLGYHVVVGQNGITVYQQKRLEDRALSKQIHDIQEENAQLKAHVDRLNSSPDAIEHEAREKLHYTRPGEVIYTLDDKQPTERATTAKTAPTATAAVSSSPNR